MNDLEQRIREHAHREMARELVAIDDNQRDATKPNPLATEGEEAIHPEPIGTVETLGDLPYQAERPDYPQPKGKHTHRSS
jgi:hypothetical protein